MGKVTIELPDDGWIATGKGITPEDKELVIAISRYGTRTPQIYQFCKANPMHPDSDYFLDIGEYWMMEEYDSNYEWNPGLMSINAVDRWKPLGLPPSRAGAVHDSRPKKSSVHRGGDYDGDPGQSGGYRNGPAARHSLSSTLPTL